MKNPWKFVSILLGALVILTLLWQYFTLLDFKTEFEKMQTKSEELLAYAQNQGVVVPNEAEELEPLQKVDPADVSADDDPHTGNTDAKMTIIVFDDFECPFCVKMHESLAEIRQKFTEDELRIVYRDFPLSGHENAMPAAKAAGAAFEQGEYFAMADLIFDNQADLSEDKYLEFAEELGLDIEKIQNRYD